MQKSRGMSEVVAVYSHFKRGLNQELGSLF